MKSIEWPGHTGNILEGRRPCPYGAGLPSLELQRPGVGETGTAPTQTVQGLGSEDSPRVQVQGPVHTVWGSAQACTVECCEKDT